MAFPGTGEACTLTQPKRFLTYPTLFQRLAEILDFIKNCRNGDDNEAKKQEGFK